MNQELDFGSIEWVRPQALGRRVTMTVHRPNANVASCRLLASRQVAYDYDFTIAHYNVSLGHTIYELAKQHLVRWAFTGVKRSAY